MRLLRLGPGIGLQEMAPLVGDVIGKYHSAWRPVGL
jgi:hypothetical protein